jgi:long-chain acyl-CoA synthetase
MSMPDRTILDLYRHDVEAPRSNHYSHYTPAGKRTLSTETFFRRTAAMARALDDLGIDRGERVLLLSDNRPEWHICDLAVLDIGAVDVPVYGTLTPEQIAYQVTDSGAVAAIADTPEQMAKLVEIRGQCPQMQHLIQLDGDSDDGVLSFEELLTAHDQPGNGDAFWDRAAKIDEHDLMTIIYTSGTTGDPKGVMLSHHNLVRNALSAAPRIALKKDDLGLEFLPLCHVLERFVSYIAMWRGIRRAYCSVYHVAELIAKVRPTLFTGVPRFYEKIHQAIMQKVADSTPLRRTMFRWATSVGHEQSCRDITGRESNGFFQSRHALADRLVLSKIREALGGRVRYCISGGAELPLYIAEFFHALGIRVIEGYGLSETSPVISVNGVEPGTLRLGTVGKPLADVEIKIAGDGELLVKGPNVMKGYWNKPAATAEAFDEEGYFCTGDIAELDEDGFLLIVDRKKDIIVTAGGKNVAPQPIENLLKRSPFIDVAVLIGDRRPFISALISPDQERIKAWATEQGIDYETYKELLELPQVHSLLRNAIRDTNASLARYEQIKAHRLISDTLSVDSGHLTPTLKVKRKKVEQDLVDLIEEMYESGGVP